MSRSIAKFTDHKTAKDYYLEWSSIVGGPVTCGMSLDAFEQYYKNQYSPQEQNNFTDRMARVEAKGTSLHAYDSVEELVAFNHAGDNEENLSLEEILEKYCLI